MKKLKKSVRYPVQLISDSVKRSPYKVGVVVFLTQNGKRLSQFKFSSDWKRFGETIEFCGTCEIMGKGDLEKIHRQLVDYSKSGNVPFETMCSVILFYICSFNQVSSVYRRLPNQSLGYFVDIDVDDYLDVSVWGGTRREMEDRYVKYIDINNSYTNK